MDNHIITKTHISNIKVGDTIGFTKWGISKIIMEDGVEEFFVQDNSDFILGVIPC